MSRTLGVISRGVRLPIIKSGEENLKDIIIDALLNAQTESSTSFKDKDIICITESIIARANNNYISVNDIADDITNKFGKNCDVVVFCPIYSRNRFSLILKGIARAAKKILLILDDNKDEVGNDKINPFTLIDIEQYYKEVVENENCEFVLFSDEPIGEFEFNNKNVIYARCHELQDEISYLKRFDGVKIYTLADICASPSTEHGYNDEYGVLGSNKATEETLKLFPKTEDCEKLCKEIQKYFKEHYDVNIEVMVYGDGCFKDPVGEIWEFADPVVSPYYTNGLEGTPNEIKIKYIADNESCDNEYIIEKIKHKELDLRGNMLSQGTTPRRYRDLIGSLADLTSGSGDKGTPVVWISGYFDNFALN